jgi:hypothetical protein
LRSNRGGASRLVPATGVQRNRHQAPGVQIVHLGHIVEIETGARIGPLVQDAAEDHHRVIGAGVTGLELQAGPKGRIGLLQPGLGSSDALLGHARIRVMV